MIASRGVENKMVVRAISASDLYFVYGHEHHNALSCAHTPVFGVKMGYNFGEIIKNRFACPVGIRSALPRAPC